LLAVCWRQWRTERTLARRGVHFRTTDIGALGAAYAAMSDREFDAINGRQDWANWRTIPRSLSGHVPDRPLTVLDLGCGTGGSTRVLAFYCPAGSRIIGYELAAPLVEIARRRSYVHRSGQAADVAFCCQGATETLRQPDGSSIAERSVDVVNASGVVGHHLDSVTIRPLISELQRVLCDGGVALLDVGPTLSDTALSAVMTATGFARLGYRRSCFLDRTGQVIYRFANR
jgi:SAM-dependent methyltransferase